MKKMIIALALLLIGLNSSANPYFRPIDIHHTQTDAINLFKLSDGQYIGSVVDLALVTHSNADGSIIPQKLQDIGFLPEPWVPLQVGFGGNVHQNALIHLGASANVSAFVAGSIIKACGGISGPKAKAVADFMTTGLDLGAKYGIIGFSAGIGIAGNIVTDGHFQSLRAMFPKQGFGENLKNSSAYSLGLAWKL